MKIEKMNSNDLSDVLSLSEQLGYPNSYTDLKARFDELQNQSDYALFVARADSGKVIGYVQINREPHTLLVGPRADIAALVVDQNERGHGVGAALLRHAEQWAWDNELPLIRVRSNLKRTEAHRFYSREGYELSKTSNIFTKRPM
jgi:GNAT superfamily N-acetyltransferase